MNAAEITALSTGIPAILAAITALITALKSHGKSSVTAAQLQAHLDTVQKPVAPNEHLMP